MIVNEIELTTKGQQGHAKRLTGGVCIGQQQWYKTGEVYVGEHIGIYTLVRHTLPNHKYIVVGGRDQSASSKRGRDLQSLRWSSAR